MKKGEININIQYQNLIREILDEGYKYTDQSRDAQCKQISSKVLEIDLKQGFPAINLKKLYWKGIVGELLWFLRGDTNIKYLLDNNIHIWDKDAYNYYKGKLTYNEWLFELENNPNNKLGNLGRVYGAQWRNFNGIKNHKILSNFPNSVDQISNLLRNLKNNPMSRRHIVTAWNPAELDDMALPPCHWSFEIIVEPLTLAHRDNIRTTSKSGLLKKEDYDELGIPKYSFTLKWHQRSVDTFLGLPFNIASYALLANIIGKLTNMVPNKLIGDLSNVHLYANSWEAARELIKRDPVKYDLPTLDYFTGFKMDMNNNFDQWLNGREIKDFKLNNYESHPALSVEMLAPK